MKRATDTAAATSASSQTRSAKGKNTAAISAPIIRPVVARAVRCGEGDAECHPADDNGFGLRTDRIRHVYDGRNEEGEQDLGSELIS